MGKTKLLAYGILVTTEWEAMEMDMEKIGSFLAELRKERGLTQEQLGQKLGVTNKTISRWETGNYLPPAQILLELSELYGLTINELLSGQRLTQAEYVEKSEEHFKEVLRYSPFSLEERVDYFKRKWQKEHFLECLLERCMIWILLLIGILTRKQIWNLAFVITNLIHYGVKRNEMMKYVEQRAYDGNGV